MGIREQIAELRHALMMERTSIPDIPEVNARIPNQESLLIELDRSLANFLSVWPHP